MLKHQQENSRSNYNYNIRYFPQFNLDQYFKPHFHKNLELHIVLSGELHLTVNGTSQVIPAGSMALVLSNQIHSFFNPKGSKDLVVVFSEDYVPKFSKTIRGQQGSSFHFIPDQTIWDMVVRYLSSGDSSLFTRKACFYGICGEYLDKIALEPRSDKSDFLVGNMLTWIANNYSEDISLKKMAQVFGYEYHYLSRLLTQEYCINFRQLVNQYRVDDAIYLLESSSLSITEIALKSGFQNARTFNHVFKEYIGHTPKEHRLKS